MLKENQMKDHTYIVKNNRYRNKKNVPHSSIRLLH